MALSFNPCEPEPPVAYPPRQEGRVWKRCRICRQYFAGHWDGGFICPEHQRILGQHSLQAEAMHEQCAA